MSFRLFSREQVSDGTSISLRLEKLLADFARRWNNVPRRDVRRRFFPDYTVTGYTPGQPNTAGVPYNWSHPFTRAFNHPSNAVSAGAEPADLIKNPFRTKGDGVVGIDGMQSGDDDGVRYTWATTFAYGRPVVVISLAVWLLTDWIFDNEFEYGAGAPHPYLNGGMVEDVSISLEVDDPWSREDRSAASQVFLRKVCSAEAGADQQSWAFSTKSSLMAAATAHGGYWGTQGTPAAYTMQWGMEQGEDEMPSGIVFIAQDLNIPLPRDSRLRLSLTLPDYEAVNTSDWRSSHSLPAEQPWDRQVIGWNLGIAEGVV